MTLRAYAVDPADLNEREDNCDTYDTFQKVILDQLHLSMHEEDRLHYLLAFKHAFLVISPCCIHNRNSCTFTPKEGSFICIFTH